MRKSLLFILTMLAATASARQKVSDLWIVMPDDMIVYVDSVRRQDLVKFYEIDRQAEIVNMFSNKTSIDTLSENYMSVRLNAVTCWQMRLLDKNDGTRLVCLVKTFAPEEGHGESEIMFYSTDWDMDESHYGLPVYTDAESLLNEFTACPDTMTAARFEELRTMIDPVMLTADLSADDDSIVLSLSTPLLNKQEEEEVKTIIKQTKFKWNGEMFK